MSKKNMESTRELMGTREVTDYSIRTYRNEELVYFLIQPSNISVLSEESLSARIYGLMTVLKGITEIEMMCLNSRENFEDNKRYLKKRMEEETNTVVSKLLEKLGNSHQVPRIAPLFVYFRLFNTPSIPFFSGFMACFYSFQKCNILGCWNFNVFLWHHFVIILQQHLFPSKNPLDTRSTPL